MTQNRLSKAITRLNLLAQSLLQKGRVLEAQSVLRMMTALEGLKR